MTNWLMLAAAEGGDGGGHGNEFTMDHPTGVLALQGTPFQIDGFTISMWVVMAVVVLLAYLATRQLSLVPRGAQNAMEAVLDGLEGWLAGFVGSRHEVKPYLPMLATFFLFILLSNYSGLIPGVGTSEWFKAPTSKWGTTAGLALIVFFMTHYMAIKKKGLGSYLHHYAEPLPFMVPLNIIEELIKPFSLSLRLFGNIFAEETVLAVVAFLVPLIMPVPVLAMSVFFGALQALVFTTLAAVYIHMASAAHH